MAQQKRADKFMKLLTWMRCMDSLNSKWKEIKQEKASEKSIFQYQKLKKKVSYRDWLIQNRN
ncbi:unnamed protein product [Paramecium sonneborni]|uniref:Uncharacterized protein n=1 Tax=Paramecium sonneborni TaxID=65129 RepID=A0A8S1RNH7_9CILI|nr:unnamed protein product [Paramecium sonneborni]